MSDLINIPSNSITFNYTIGKDFFNPATMRPYIGYYYQIGNRVFAGRTFDPNAPELKRLSEFPIMNQVYAKLNNTPLTDEKPQSYYFNKVTSTAKFRYFIAEISNKSLIKEITEETYTRFKTNPAFISVRLDYPFIEEQLNEAEKQIPGIRTFINTIYVPGPTD